MIEPEHPRLSIVRQCELVSISRSGFYHCPAGETLLNLELMRLVTRSFWRRLGMARVRWRGSCGEKAMWSAASGFGG